MDEGGEVSVEDGCEEGEGWKDERRLVIASDLRRITRGERCAHQLNAEALPVEGSKSVQHLKIVAAQAMSGLVDWRRICGDIKSACRVEQKCFG